MKVGAACLPYVQELDRLVRIVDLEAEGDSATSAAARASAWGAWASNGKPGPRPVSRSWVASKNSRANTPGSSALLRHLASIRTTTQFTIATSSLRPEAACLMVTVTPER